MTSLEVAKPVANPVNEETPTKPATIEALTGLRFVAACLVYLTHLYSLSSANKALPVWVGNIMVAGNKGVPLFFVLSGFVITYNYADRLARPNKANLRNFFVARFARIYPLYFVALVFILAQFNLGEEIKQHGSLIVQHFLMVQAWNPSMTEAFNYNVPGWSIGVEIILYLCFPLLAWLVLPRLQRAWQLVTLAGLVYFAKFALATYFNQSDLLANPDYSNTVSFWLFRNPLPHLADFIMGCAAAQLYLKGQTRPPGKMENRLGTILLVAGISGTLMMMAIAPKGQENVYFYDVAYLPFFTLVIFCLARYHNWLSQFLNTRLLILLGEASYAFYLIHFYFIYVNGLSLSRIGQPSAFLQGVTVFGLTVTVAVGAYTFIERPARRFIRQLGQKSAKSSHN